MKTALVLALAAIMILTFGACAEDDDEEASMTKAELSAGVCEKLSECNQPLVDSMFGGNAACPENLQNMAFAETDCPVYDGVEAVKCEAAIQALPCDELLIVLTPEGTMPASCDASCTQ